MKNLKNISKKIIKSTCKVFVICHIVLGIVIIFLGIYLLFNNPPTTSLMQYRKYAYNHNIKPVKFVPLKKIPQDILKMAIATEDYKFYRHPGIDIEAIKRAYFINKKVGYRMFGGSTITQQLSRTLFLVPKKLMIRKYIEALISLGIELVLPKERILELYLNYCELGKGVFGIAQAAKHHYNKEIDNLTIDESTRLVTILANPIDYGPYSFDKKKFLRNRYYIIKFRYYTYLKFNENIN